MINVRRRLDVQYNGKHAYEFGIYSATFPEIPAGEEDVTEFEIPGRDGILHRREGTIKDIEIPITFIYDDENPEQLAEKRRRIRTWLCGTGDWKLTLGNDSEWYWKVKKVILDADEYQTSRARSFVVTFTCEGLKYKKSGDVESTSKYFINDYFVSHPIYTITGTGLCTLVVNDKTMTVNVGDGITIDTDKKVAYGIVKKDLRNTNVTGDYEDLYFIHGDNKVNYPAGFTVSIKPRWRSL